MAIYTIQFQIQSNAPVEDLGYQLEVYKTINDIPRYALHQTPITPLEAGYKTQLHRSLEIDPTKDQHFILHFMLFKKVNGEYKALYDKPKTKLYSLDNPPKLSESKTENICFFITRSTLADFNKTIEYNNSIAKVCTVKITKRPRPFEDQVYKQGTDKDPFSKETIEQQLQNRLIGFDYPHQKFTSLCGPAAFFYCLLKDQPDIYKQVVKDLWESGNVQLGNLTIKPSNDCRYPKGIHRLGISGLDWITLASLRDTENTIMDYQVRENFISEGLAGITMVSAAKSWFEKVGAKCIFDNTMLWTPFGLNHAKLKHLLDLNLYADKSNYHVVVLIGAGMLDGTDDRETGEYPSPSKEHWIVWEGKVTSLKGDEITEATPLTEKVKLKAFSWGRVEENYLRPDLTLGELLGYIFGGFIVTKIL
ncbi:hypothetical protein MTZ49_09515 [Entomomonas sp. E2T0]|uniref:hypothetical protein n=1 Tax=Entomomonas sp. E2T0 TaxID=2930213 RepID=UPI00222842F7|nr:hypothetical protein [Entomomonas sp. E2T0]UYZ82849.1 hypothetical protein MTZ49_09515 [Entomomonas sp. E2T0]